MSERPCPRCHTVLVNEDSGVLVYCTHCGAPQVLLSEELREQAAENAVAQIAAQTGGAVAGNFAEAGLTSLDTGDPTAVDWAEGVRAAGLGGLIALALGLLSMAVAPLSYVELLWALIAPIVVLGIYCSRRKQTRVRAGFGARLGLVTGLAISVAMFTVEALDDIFQRFVLHHGADIDARLAAAFATVRQAQAGQPTPPFFNDMIPEFRVGMILSSFAFGMLLYLIYAAVSGAFGGFLRSRSRTV